ncbi:rho GTPase-activating protein 19-like isoform X1 [Onthophagus taurus]|uniref:rho GTPase-activating protein 19-like isoform X1 n=1 Tax=Onthophagus taurus TaxID=166361 RepID=UPI000C2025D9|nr:rho GTPase-activating protein 19-like isoform X1 [Onthophagus taurus]
MSLSSLGDDELAERLRTENCEQFNTLVRMHLSFVLDLNTDESDGLNEKGKLKKWLLTPFKKSKQRLVPEGINLTQNAIDQIRYLIEFLKEEANICIEGIFRRTGSLNRQQELRTLLNSGLEINLENGHYNVHDCASVLKGFLSDLPEPLLTEAHYPVYCQIAHLKRSNDKFKEGTRFMESLQLLLLLLPKENRILLKYVLDLLNLTASYENLNKMSVENLATLYTPHLLCPRTISPENLHTNSQILSEILAFMITKSPDLFQVPKKLAFDIRAFFVEQEKEPQRKNNFNESISDNVAAHTVFSFVDHVRTAKENEANPTERELAQLYAYIQSLPESSKKKKLVKQFNKENGYGTPLQVVRSRNQKNKSFGDSIKKHIFHKSLVKSVKKAGFTQLRASNENNINNEIALISSTTKRALCCTNFEESTSDLSEAESCSLFKRRRKSNDVDNDEKTKLLGSDESLSGENGKPLNYLTSTPACRQLRNDLLFTPENQDRKSMSPITKSTQHMSRAMQETMMTPRSRKPVLVVSGTNLHNIPKAPSNLMSSLVEEQETEENDSLTETFREYLCSRSMLTESPNDASFSSRTDDYSSSDIKDLSASKMSSSLLHCLDGNDPDGENENAEEKELVLKPRQFDENGMPVVFETSF